MRVPFVDLRAQYATIKADVDAAMSSVLRDSAFIGGPYVLAFERAFAEYCGVSHVVGTSNGTDALRLALAALGVGPGDEVITVPNTFIATSEAVSMLGAGVRFVDVDEQTLTMDAIQLEAAITHRTRAIIPVHLYGHPTDMDPILAIARSHGLKVVADAAQAHGAIYRGRHIATLGDVACFSFYPSKNLGAYGDAGAIATNDSELAGRIASLRDHGRSEKYLHETEGYSCRMDGLQAAVLSAKLRYLRGWTEQRRRHAARYTALLTELPGVRTPTEAPDCVAVYHLYVLQLNARDAVRGDLKARGIETGVHYPVPLHRQPAYERLKLPEGSFPVAEAQSRSVVSLPLFAELTDEQLEFVAVAVREAVSR